MGKDVIVGWDQKPVPMILAYTATFEMTKVVE
jgi:hypothetical protein